MKQIKYLIYASLLLGLAFLCIISFDKIYNSSFIAIKSSVVIDADTPSEPITKGKNLFQQNCQSCHALDKKLTGPALRGFTERGPWSDRKNIYAWIKNPAAFMEKDIYTQKLKAEYSVTMQAFPTLSNEDVDAIVEYLSKPVAYVSKI